MSGGKLYEIVIEIFKKLLSFVLTISLACIYPIQAAATDNYEQEVTNLTNLETTQNETMQEDDISTQRSIVGEITSDREQYSKYFRMSDGSVMIAQYDYPIHFKNENGKWVEYDNTLTLDNSELSTEIGSESEENSEYTNSDITTEVQTIFETEPQTEVPTKNTIQATTLEVNSAAQHNNSTEEIVVQSEDVSAEEISTHSNENAKSVEQATVESTVSTEFWIIVNKVDKKRWKINKKINVQLD